jgi:hypothetical protein
MEGDLSKLDAVAVQCAATLARVIASSLDTGTEILLPRGDKNLNRESLVKATRLNTRQVAS